MTSIREESTYIVQDFASKHMLCLSLTLVVWMKQTLGKIQPNSGFLWFFFFLPWDQWTRLEMILGCFHKLSKKKIALYLILVLITVHKKSEPFTHTCTLLLCSCEHNISFAISLFVIIFVYKVLCCPMKWLFQSILARLENLSNLHHKLNTLKCICCIFLKFYPPKHFRETDI